MAFDLNSLLETRRGENYELHRRHLNAQMVRVLSTIGCDRLYERGKGAWLIDRDGQRHLDFLSGFGVFALGRSHPSVKRALSDVLGRDLPALAQMDCALLPGLLAESLLALAPRSLYCTHGYHGLSYGALSVIGEDDFRTGFGPFLPGCHALPFGDAEALERELARRAVGAVLCRDEIFAKVFHHMDRALVHGSTFAKNPLAMAAGLATLHAIQVEGLIERAARLGELFLHRIAPIAEKYDLLQEVRGKGLMIAFEFGGPRSLKLEVGYALIEAAREGLFSQLVTVPLFQRHRILTQVAGPHVNAVEILPPLIIGEEEIELFARAFEDVVADCHRYPGTLWDFGRTLAKQALRGSA